ncbi:hypothetical protein SH1V18_29280 [Vallitalea longa]|uniref:Uncharacterized protein n=1 Tax=Vallitalea longa TaxID=2936439 RepID=A0A9W5YFW3_9FIRM|nr:hypothetical protein [Vallitalea longa]GKX30448.1 hypothetical protein SH1V18_29280 [Vallitalea longa]
MNVIETSFIYRIIKYIDRIHEYSFFYKTRRKKRIHKSTKLKLSMYEYSIIYKLLCTIGRGFNSLFNLINKGCKTSIIINAIGKMTEDIKHKKLHVFNQFMISFIIGYIISNIAFNMFASYKIKYVLIFAVLTFVVNIMFRLINKYRENSLLVSLMKKIVD